jgi:arginine decarboxylase-like protein
VCEWFALYQGTTSVVPHNRGKRRLQPLANKREAWNNSRYRRPVPWRLSDILETSLRNLSATFQPGQRTLSPAYRYLHPRDRDRYPEEDGN